MKKRTLKLGASAAILILVAAAPLSALDILGTQRGKKVDFGKVHNFFGLQVVRTGTDRIFNVYKHESGEVTPRYCDNQIKRAHAAGLRPIMNLIQYTKTWGANDPWYPLADTVHTNAQYGTYYKWYKIGRAMAERFGPGSEWNRSQGHGDTWGVRTYMLFNEIDGDWYWRNEAQTKAIPVSMQEYHDINEAFADGVHSIDKKLDVYLGPLACSQAWRLTKDLHAPLKGFVWKDYLKSVGDLFNKGKLTGWGLQMYLPNKTTCESWEWTNKGSYSKVAQWRYDEGLNYAGITSNPRFYSTEFNSGGDADDPNTPRLLLPHTINYMTVIDKNKKPVTDFALFFNIYWEPAKHDNLVFIEKGTDFDAVKANARGRVVMMLTTLLEDAWFVDINHSKGLYTLLDTTGRKRTVWLFNNFACLSSNAGTSLTLSGFSSPVDSMQVYRYNSYKQPVAGKKGTLDPWRRMSVADTATAVTLAGLPENESFCVVAYHGAVSRAAHNGPHGIPGLIEAEDFDNGGEGVAWHDSTPANSGKQYRTTEVDIKTTGDPDGGGFDVGWTADGEWLEYTIAAVAAGTYDIRLRAGSGRDGAKVRVLLDNSVLGTVNMPNLGNWSDKMTVAIPGVKLPKAKNAMLRLEIVKGGVDINWIEFVKAQSTGVIYNNLAEAEMAFSAQRFTIIAPNGRIVYRSGISKFRSNATGIAGLSRGVYFVRTHRGDMMTGISRAVHE